ncbi:hypothetical protein KAR91_69450 [Candidatus Pacearchaeota archaeon]|nr:hypothetical protein [Candidatus Pacearchaeota archaeon]
MIKYYLDKEGNLKTGDNKGVYCPKFCVEDNAPWANCGAFCAMFEVAKAKNQALGRKNEILPYFVSIAKLNCCDRVIHLEREGQDD